MSAPDGRAARGTWVAGLVVALGAGVATAHGLFEVAAAAGVPFVIACLYPLITDGLALVAYAATARLRAGSRGYAWSVVVLAAGLSGLAQAAYLAGGVASAPTTLRFGVGAWPAIAAAMVAHLLHLLRAQPAPADTNASTDQLDAVHPVQPAAVQLDVQSGVQPETGRPVQVDERQLALPYDDDPDVRRPAGELDGPDSSATGGRGGQPARERARAAARRHAHHHGDLPTVSELMALAGVSRGTAGTALQEVRDLHLVNGHVETGTNR